MPIMQSKVVRFRKRKNQKVLRVIVVVSTLIILALILLTYFGRSTKGSIDPFAGFDKTHQYETCPANIGFNYEPLRITGEKVIAAVKRERDGKWGYCEVDVMGQLTEESP